jgi:hypothetical protein
MAKPATCVSCAGAGELVTENGPVDCPDCGGAGTLPTRAVLSEWRMRDLSRALTLGGSLSAADATWLIDELREARTALTEIIALAHDIRDDAQIALRIRMVASHAIGLYQLASGSDEAGEAPSRAS